MYESVPLHGNLEFIEPCVEVLREEWSRSVASRLSMLEKSNNNLPYSIVLLKRDRPDASEVVGHSRLCKVFQEPQAAFVESVVIRKDHRGLGLGRKLMDETESHAKKLGLGTLYLTTHDKQGFYQHLGYEFCQPIVSFGSASSLLSEQQLSKLVDQLGLKTNENQMKDFRLPSQTDKGCQQVRDSAKLPSGSSLPPPPPPPPCSSLPPPPKASDTKIMLWMKKKLAS